MEPMEVSINYSENYGTFPIGALNVACRQKLAMALNPEMILPTSDGLPRNWMGLLELMEYPYETVRLLRNNEDPTNALLDMWERDMQPKVARLLEYLELIERQDVIDDIMPLVEKDCRAHLNRMAKDKLRLEHLKPLQDDKVTSGTQRNCPITVSEVNVAEYPTDGFQKTYDYDAYVFYVESDIQFVIKLIHILEKEFHLRLYVKERDMLVGVPESEASFTMIHERCERILLIISPEFLSDSTCEVYTVFAQSQATDNNMYSRKVIPVICKPSRLPVRLKYFAHIDYTKADHFESFWHRLYSSIKKVPQGELSSSAMSLNASVSSMVESETNSSPITTRSLGYPMSSLLIEEPKGAECVVNETQTEMEPLPTQSQQHKKGPKRQNKFRSLLSSLRTTTGNYINSE